MLHLTTVPHSTLPVLQLASRPVEMNGVLHGGCFVCMQAMQLSKTS